MRTFVNSQLLQIQKGGYSVLFIKMKRALLVPIELLLHILAIPVVLVLRMIRPWLLLRWGVLISTRIGHFAGNTEMYLYERDACINVPRQSHIDLFYMGGPICNQQLAIMWKRVLCVWPSWILTPISRVNHLIPGGVVHEIGNNTQSDRDVYNLRDKYPPYLEFTPEEEDQGESRLREMGLPTKTPFVCLSMRDSAYLAKHIPDVDFSYHNYRDSDIQSYVLAAEELADRGYFIIRMGANVSEAINTTHPRVVDYATNGMRSDFMDIYLSAKCEFFLSTGEGMICVPKLFRRPIVVVNMVPIGYFYTYYSDLVGITKHHYLIAENRELNLREIFNQSVGFCLETTGYSSKGVELIENTPEEIRDVVIEMVERLNGTWQPHVDDESLQRRFFEIFPTDAVDAYQGRPLHGEIRARFGAHFLRNNHEWLQ